jgi:serine/threonine protein kinase
MSFHLAQPCARCLCPADRQIRNEVEIHTQISHPHIVKCHGYFTDEHRLFLVMDLAAGELYRKLKAQPQGRFDESVAAKYIRQLIGALIFLHENVHPP